MGNCISHHHACECREEAFRLIEEENKLLKLKVEKLSAAEKEIRWLTRLVETLRDYGNLRYGDNTGVLAFSDLKDLARKGMSEEQ